MTRDVIVVPRVVARAAGFLVVLAAVAVGVVVPGPRDAIARTLWPREVADRGAVDAQRDAAEGAIQRGYSRAVGQLRQVGQLTLAIPATDAAAIAQRAANDLIVVRRDALAAVGQVSGLRDEALRAYVADAEARLGSGEPSAGATTLLAPDLFAVVRRANEVMQQVADAATRELTRAPAASPTPVRTPSPSPTRSP